MSEIARRAEEHQRVGRRQTLIAIGHDSPQSNARRVAGTSLARSSAQRCPTTQTHHEPPPAQVYDDRSESSARVQLLGSTVLG